MSESKRHDRYRVILLVTAFFVPLIGSAGDRDPCAPARRVEQREPFDFSPFLAAVAAYSELHCAIDLELAPLASVPGEVAGLSARAELARRMREARSRAVEGELFSPCVSEEIRIRIDETLFDHDYRDLAEHLAEYWPDGRPPDPRLNGPAPDNRAPMSPLLLAALPPLPEELQYQFVGRDLALVDIHADLVVDFIRDVIPQMCLPRSGVRER